jgi:hypothetical protein
MYQGPNLPYSEPIRKKVNPNVYPSRGEVPLYNNYIGGLSPVPLFGNTIQEIRKDDTVYAPYSLGRESYRDESQFAKPVVKGPIRTTQDISGLSPIQGKGFTFNAAKAPKYYIEPHYAKAPVTEEEYSPTLSPLGHIASGIANIADRIALGRAEPSNITLQGVTPERIDLSRERILAERDAANQRAINLNQGRNMMNPGQAYANATIANTGVDRVLRDTLAKSFQTEETTNAQMRMRANELNAEIKAQESLFNAERRDAFNMLKARMNPIGNTLRTAASYFKDNAAYGQQYDTLKMLAPNARVIAPEKRGFFPWLLGNKPRIKLR